MDKLSSFLKNRLSTYDLGTSAEAAQVIFRANEFLKDRFDPQVQATTLKKGILVISVPHPIYAQELSVHLPHLTQTLQKEFGKAGILKIRTKCLTTP